MNSQATIDRLRSSTGQTGPSLSVGTLTAEVMDQRAAVQTLEQQGIDMLHIDVMDGRIWPKITVGHFFVAGLKTSLLKDVHLLIEEPESQIPAFCKAGADMIAFSVESCRDIGAALDLMSEQEQQSEAPRRIQRGLSLYPKTSLDLIRPHLDKTDYVTLVSIGPDTGKENFLAEVPDRIKQLREWKPDLLICVDGGIKKNNIGAVATMGADVIVTGSAVFDGNDAAQNLVDMNASIQQAV